MPATATKPAAKRPARRTVKPTTLFLHEHERKELLRQMAEHNERELSRYVVRALGLEKAAA